MLGWAELLPRDEVHWDGAGFGQCGWKAVVGWSLLHMGNRVSFAMVIIAWSLEVQGGHLRWESPPGELLGPCAKGGYSAADGKK